MFFHKDLSIYTNKNFRSYEFLKSIWCLLETDFLYMLGLIKTGNVTIVIDPDAIYVACTSNYYHVIDYKYNINFNHSLCLCENFSIEIELQITNKQKQFCIDIDKCKLYFHRNRHSDEGIVEFSATTNLSIENYIKFKNILFLSLSKEIQFAINRNIFNLDIDGDDFSIAEIDSDFEYSKTYSFIYNITHAQAINNLVSDNLIYKQNKFLLKELLDLTN